MIALFCAQDAHHERCVEQLRQLRPPLLTCWPVLTEAAWLLRRDESAVTGLLESIRTGLLQILQLEDEAAPWIAAFLRQYHNLQVQLADAALMYLAEHGGIETIFTLDHRDFSVFRLAGRRQLRLLPSL